MAAYGAPQTQSSHGYMWSTRDKLGHGATGQVYLGYNRVIYINYISNLSMILVITSRRV